MTDMWRVTPTMRVGEEDSWSRFRSRLTDRGAKALELSLREALQLGHNYIGTEHILLGLIREGEGVAAVALNDLGIDLVQVRQAVIRIPRTPSVADEIAALRKRLDELEAGIT